MKEYKVLPESMFDMRPLLTGTDDANGAKWKLQSYPILDDGTILLLFIKSSSEGKPESFKYLQLDPSAETARTIKEMNHEAQGNAMLNAMLLEKVFDEFAGKYPQIMGVRQSDEIPGDSEFRLFHAGMSGGHSAMALYCGPKAQVPVYAGGRLIETVENNPEETIESGSRDGGRFWFYPAPGRLVYCGDMDANTCTPHLTAMTCFGEFTVCGGRLLACRTEDGFFVSELDSHEQPARLILCSPDGGEITDRIIGKVGKNAGKMLVNADNVMYLYNLNKLL